MEKAYKNALLVVVINSVVLVLQIANIMFGQSDKNQFLEQSNVEQQQEKEYYITRTQELENIIKDSGIVVDDCECE